MPGEIVLVRFLRLNPPYNATETAGFRPEVARALVESGAAEYVDKSAALETLGPAASPPPAADPPPPAPRQEGAGGGEGRPLARRRQRAGR